MPNDAFENAWISNHIILTKCLEIQDKSELDANKNTGDGNCLYRSISLVLVGHENFHLLLRLLTAIELFSHASFHAKHPNFVIFHSLRNVSEDIMFTLCLSDTGTKMWEDTKSREDAIKKEAVTGCRKGTWSVMIHLVALASVIGRSIFSAYAKD